mmetsp:Transcript_24660/g.41197  ORF Transcript_24660/g.41197 Transcript_24660/m.41197 type:complete len:163 (+) Transcript_24660:45-533(+)
MKAHMEGQCMHRPVPCPYESVGCVVQLRCKDLGQHLQEGAFMHLAAVWAETREKTTHLEARTEAVAAQIWALSSNALVEEIVKLKQVVEAQAKTMGVVQKELGESKSQLKQLLGETKLAGCKLDTKVSVNDWKAACSEIKELRTDLKNASQKIIELQKNALN